MTCFHRLAATDKYDWQRMHILAVNSTYQVEGSTEDEVTYYVYCVKYGYVRANRKKELCEKIIRSTT